MRSKSSQNNSDCNVSSGDSRPAGSSNTEDFHKREDLVDQCVITANGEVVRYLSVAPWRSRGTIYSLVQAVRVVP